jgi:hypothetical protein
MRALPLHRIPLNEAQRLSIGLAAALALTLVAMEWRAAGALPAWSMGEALPLESPPEVAPIPYRAKSDARSAPRKPSAQRAALLADARGPDDAAAPDGLRSDAADAGAHADSSSLQPHSPPEAIEDFLIPWRKGDERMPCWNGCEQLRGAARDACTEARIQRHLDRVFRVPPEGLQEEFTVITLEIGTDGAPGAVVCRPRPSPAVEQEVLRVMRAMPPFIPAEQNGRAVRVIYQLPLRVARR